MAFGLLLLAIVVFVVFEYIPLKKDMKRDKERQEERAKIHLRHQGGTALYYPPNWDKETDGDFFNYEIRSWDGGKNWYAIDYNWDTEEFKVLGDASELYPGLLEHIIGMKQLTDYVEKNGSISLDGSDPLGLDALENAGFEIKYDTAQ